MLTMTRASGDRRPEEGRPVRRSRPEIRNACAASGCRSPDRLRGRGQHPVVVTGKAASPVGARRGYGTQRRTARAARGGAVASSGAHVLSGPSATLASTPVRTAVCAAPDDGPAAGRSAGDLQLQRPEAAGPPAAADPARPGRRGHLLRPEHQQPGADQPGRREVAAGRSELAEPRPGAVAADDRPGGRPGPPPARLAEEVGEADRRVRQPGLGGAQCGPGRRAEPAWRRPERQPGAGPGRVPQGGQLHRRVRPLLQQGSERRLGTRRGFHQGPAGQGRRRDRQAFPRPRRGNDLAEH